MTPLHEWRGRKINPDPSLNAIRNEYVWEDLMNRRQMLLAGFCALLTSVTITERAPAAATPVAVMMVIPPTASDDDQKMMIASIRRQWGADAVQMLVADRSDTVHAGMGQFIRAGMMRDGLRVLLVDKRIGPKVCPSPDTQPIRPGARTLIVAPACVKLMVLDSKTDQRKQLAAEGWVRTDLQADPFSASSVAYIVTDGLDRLPEPVRSPDGNLNLAAMLHATRLDSPQSAAVLPESSARRPTQVAVASVTLSSTGRDAPPVNATPRTEAPQRSATITPAAPRLASTEPKAEETITSQRSILTPPQGRSTNSTSSNAARIKPQIPQAPTPQVKPPIAMVSPATSRPNPEPRPTTASPITTPVDAPLQPKLLWPVSQEVKERFDKAGLEAKRRGLIFAAQAKTPVRAAADGEVVYVGSLDGYGQLVAIKHGNDWATVYAGIVRPRIHTGQQVQAGDVLAEADGPLNFQLRFRGRPVDPLLHLPM